VTFLARRALAARRTALWVAFNVCEFDRQRLAGSGAWLFGRRPIRPQRPQRRIVVAAWLVVYSFLIVSSGDRWATGHDRNAWSAVAATIGLDIGVGVACGAAVAVAWVALRRLGR
jgi:uncharacterized membrane protein YcjF (UPF0283 family)